MAAARGEREEGLAVRVVAASMTLVVMMVTTAMAVRSRGRFTKAAVVIV